MSREPYPEYFETHFKDSGLSGLWPDAFAVITAYQTTGSTWEASANELADARLKAYLESENLPHWRLTGYSPKSGHAEPGWAVVVDFEKACEIGSLFVQDAIYYVNSGDLFVSHCDHSDRKPVRVGPFFDRLSHE
ncbi:MAG: DUF3293 domain-containing protein [bacterium]